MQKREGGVRLKKVSASCLSCSKALPRAIADHSVLVDAKVDLRYSSYNSSSLHSTLGFLVIKAGVRPACNGF